MCKFIPLRLQGMRFGRGLHGGKGWLLRSCAKTDLFSRGFLILGAWAIFGIDVDPYLRGRRTVRSGLLGVGRGGGGGQEEVLKSDKSWYIQRWGRFEWLYESPMAISEFPVLVVTLGGASLPLSTPLHSPQKFISDALSPKHHTSS
jgi:hypothetical protein